MAACLVNVTKNWQSAQHKLEEAGCSIDKLGGFGNMRGQFVRTLHCRWTRRSHRTAARALHDLEDAQLRSVPRLMR